MWLIAAFYLVGYGVRRLEGAAETREALPFAKGLTPRARQGLLLASSALLLVGCLAYKRPQDATFGPQNMAGGSAAFSLLKGEARQYHRGMRAREALFHDLSQKEITLKPLSAVPGVFMKDLLAPGAAHDIRPVLCAYYGKEAIHLAEEVR